ncbi:hypothetical protein Zmor_018225 [Zophobas morio]|uniref:Uncharacterized protein n=1 Tax=Zophobas morio TaxID=2755281 RepID=A0AA38IDT3_9CUCU|nr:hypothetical protein Zmor_018225 [Zophobas morio]
MSDRLRMCFRLHSVKAVCRHKPLLCCRSAGYYFQRGFEDACARKVTTEVLRSYRKRVNSASGGGSCLRPLVGSPKSEKVRSFDTVAEHIGRHTCISLTCIYISGE